MNLFVSAALGNCAIPGANIVLMPDDEAAWTEICRSDTMGSWQAHTMGIFDLHGCAELCRRCDNCHWVSYSSSQSQCSWYQTCDLNKRSTKNASDDATTMRVHQHDAALDATLASLPTMFHRSLPCSITQIPTDPAVACAARPAKPCWMRTEQEFHHTSMYPPGSLFRPDFVWALQGEAPAIELRGGDCAACSFPYRGRSFVYLGLCGRARLRTGHGGATSSVLSVQCIKEPTLADGDDDGGEGKKRSFRTPSRLVLGVFSGTHAIWQHQMTNGLPNLGMLMPLMHYAGVANVSLLHNGLLDTTANTIGHAVSPADCHGSPTSWHLLRVGVDVRSGHEIQNLVLPIPMPRYMGHEDSYPSFAYSWTTGGRHKVGQGVHSHGLAQRHGHADSTTGNPGHRKNYSNESGADESEFVALLLRPKSTSRSFVDEALIVTALQGVFKRAGIPLRVAHDWPLAHFRHAVGLIGVHGGALANMVAMPPGSRVIEIVGRLGPRSFASAALGLGHKYYVYFPRTMPPPVMKKKAAWSSSHGTVKVDVEHFTTFVREVWGIV